MGDWGTQFGMLIQYMAEIRPEGLGTEGGRDEDVSDLMELYRASKKRFDDDEGARLLFLFFFVPPFKEMVSIDPRLQSPSPGLARAPLLRRVRTPAGMKALAGSLLRSPLPAVQSSSSGPARRSLGCRAATRPSWPPGGESATPRVCESLGPRPCQPAVDPIASRVPPLFFSSLGSARTSGPVPPETNPEFRYDLPFLLEPRRREFNKIYERLGVTLEERGESFYNPFLQGLLHELKEKVSRFPAWLVFCLPCPACLPGLVG